MNLFYNPSLTDLSALLEQCPKTNDINLIVEYDGEVLIEKNSEKKQSRLNKYKFYIRGLGKSFAGNAAHNMRYINNLFKDLVYCWEKNIEGGIDYDKISNIKTKDKWSRSATISEN